VDDVDATSFELNVVVPSDPRYTGTMRELAVHAARYAGCRGSDADRYGAAVEHVVRACLADGSRASVPVIVRRGAGSLEFLIACDITVETASPDMHITIGWTEEAGRRMCRVARSMPADV
jgi:hypothetical protein